MKISKQARRDAKTLFRHCCTGGLLNEGRVRLTVEQLVSRRPRGYVAILSHFQRLLRLDIERRTARVESPIPLSGAMEEAIRASLAQKHGQGLNVSFSQNPSLIGGLRIQAGSDLYDSSIQNRLNLLAESF